MNKPLVFVIVVAGVVLAGGGTFVLVPHLQSSETELRARTSAHAERARRLLRQFSQNQERIGALLEALTRSGISADIDVEELLEDEENRTAVEEEDARLHDITRQGAGEQRDLEERFLRAAHGQQWQQYQVAVRRRLGTNVSQMTRSLSEGLRERARLLAENRRLLEEALGAVNQALAESAGDLSSREDVHANRLKAIILRHQAQAQCHRAESLRREAARFRAQLATLALAARSLVNEKDLVADSGIDEYLATAERNIAEAEAALGELQASSTAVQADIERIKSQLAEARVTADQARTAMERMQARGLDLTDPQGFEKFSAEFDELARTYRQAVSQAHRLESGTLLNARIDRGGDLIDGRYVPADGAETIQIDRGLVGLESRLSALQLRTTAAQRAVESARTFHETLVSRRAAYQERRARATTRLQELAESASKAYAELSRFSAEAEKTEAAAIDLYGKSASAFIAAARFAATRSSAASTALAGLAPEARERSPDNRVAEDAWLEQQYKANAADAQIELGRLYYTISREAKRTAEVLANLPEGLAPPDLDPTTWQEKQEDARTRGIDVLHTAYDSLQRARRIPQGQWTLAAEAAAAASLLALLGEEDLRDVAIATYQQVVAGHEDKPHMQPYVNRLRALGRQ